MFNLLGYVPIFAETPFRTWYRYISMKCPLDNTELKITDRQGIEIDYCPQCRGVWLDRGELDKIIERTGPSQRDTSNDRGSRRRDDDDDRRGGFFSNLFDFD